MNRKKIIGIIVIIAVVAVLVIRLKSNHGKTLQKVYQYDI